MCYVLLNAMLCVLPLRLYVHLNTFDHHHQPNDQLHRSLAYYILSLSLPFLYISDDVKYIWQNCDAVCFDVDSTVVMEEGLDELAAYLGKGEEIAAL